MTTTKNRRSACEWTKQTSRRVGGLAAKDYHKFLWEKLQTECLVRVHWKFGLPEKTNKCNEKSSCVIHSYMLSTNSLHPAFRYNAVGRSLSTAFLNQHLPNVLPAQARAHFWIRNHRWIHHPFSHHRLSPPLVLANDEELPNTLRKTWS